MWSFFDLSKERGGITKEEEKSTPILFWFFPSQLDVKGEEGRVGSYQSRLAITKRWPAFSKCGLRVH